VTGTSTGTSAGWGVTSCLYGWGPCGARGAGPAGSPAARGEGPAAPDEGPAEAAQGPEGAAEAASSVPWGKAASRRARAAARQGGERWCAAGGPAGPGGDPAEAEEAGGRGAWRWRGSPPRARGRWPPLPGAPPGKEAEGEARRPERGRPAPTWEAPWGASTVGREEAPGPQAPAAGKPGRREEAAGAGCSGGPRCAGWERCAGACSDPGRPWWQRGRRSPPAARPPAPPGRSDQGRRRTGSRWRRSCRG
jgi:hypothetical protein